MGAKVAWYGGAGARVPAEQAMIAHARVETEAARRIERRILPRSGCGVLDRACQNAHPVRQRPLWPSAGHPANEPDREEQDGERQEERRAPQPARDAPRPLRRRRSGVALELAHRAGAEDE